MRALLALCLLSLTAFALSAADGPAWTELVGEKAGEVWKSKVQGWIKADSVEVDPKNDRRLLATAGKKILVNGKNGSQPDLVTKESFGDVELEMEFLIPTRSNSGVKFHALYEIQILDSHGKKVDKLTGDDCGGIYPRAELSPFYKHIDKGIAPKTNACKKPGEWQKLTVVFLAPRFDKDGKKTANARIVKATLNGETIHENVELKTPTGHNWKKMESATGPVLLQGDHGPVAFRNVRVRPYKPQEEEWNHRDTEKAGREEGRNARARSTHSRSDRSGHRGSPRTRPWVARECLSIVPGT
jgi:hypothetical protein